MIPVEYQQFVNGPVEVVIRTPGSVERELIFTDSGFNNHGEAVFFKDTKKDFEGDQFPVEVRVEVPMDDEALDDADDLLDLEADDVPVMVTVDPDNAEPVTGAGTSGGTKVRLMVTGR